MDMKRIDADDELGRSADVASENLEQLRTLFPEAFTEGKLDLQVLRQLVGDLVVDEATDGKMPDEKYGLNWKGKRRARQLALTPSLGTLRPCPEESVDWDTTKNLMIEGDNLEVLKLLQKSYSGKVKLIYIDPPYNTGKDFVYPDNFHDNIRNYLELTGQVDGEGRKLTSNPESSGRFHTDWLNMMYPRLKLARNLLRDDGVIFISIDDGELNNLKSVCDEVFGDENFISSFVWKSRQNKDNRTVTGASIDHEYVLCYGKKIRGCGRDLSQYSNPDNDPRGAWTSGNMVGLATADSRPNLHYHLVDPGSGIDYGCPKMGWRYDRSTMARLISEGRIIWPASQDGRPRRKSFLSELSAEFTGFSSIVGGSTFTRDGTADIDSLFSQPVFDFPKPVALISELLEQGMSDTDLVLDFFAGSGSTGHAIMGWNAVDGGKRRYILVQLPEPLKSVDKDQKTAADFCDKLGKPRTIAELTKERLRRAGSKIREELEAKWAKESAEAIKKSAKPGLFETDVDEDNLSQRSMPDLGFRVFKLDTSNIRVWNPEAANLKSVLLDNTEHILPDRSNTDVLYEMLLKLGLDLVAPISERTIAGKKVVSIGSGSLMACLEKDIETGIVEELAKGIAAWHAELAPAGETTVFFRDSAFADDVAKSNLTAILEQVFAGRKKDLRIRSI